MVEGTDRPAWTQTLFQGMGSGLQAFKHRIVHRDSEAVLLKDFDWAANANAVKVNGGD